MARREKRDDILQKGYTFIYIDKRERERERERNSFFPFPVVTPSRVQPMAPPLVRLRGRQQKTRQSPQSDPVLCRVGKRGEEPTQEQTFIYYEHKHTENKYIYISIQYFPLQTPLTPPNLYKKNETRTAKDSNLRFPPFHKILSNAHIRFGPLKFNEIPTLFLANAQSKDSQFGYATGGTANVFRTS